MKPMQITNKPYLQRITHLILLFIILLSPASVYCSEIHGVLVSSKDSNIKKLERKDIRRLFLGIKPAHDNMVDNPVINISDKKTYSLFLKKIMFLTEGGYKRKLIKRVFRRGADEVRSIESHDALANYLASHPNDISFMAKEDALKHQDLKIIQALW